MAAVTAQPLSTNPFKNPFSHPSPKSTKDEWEDWDVDSDDSNSAPSPLIDLSGDGTRKSSHKPVSTRLTQHRSVHLPRVKSRARQKAQNAKAGIKLVTDMSQFRQTGAYAQQRGVESTNNKFADIAALQALEGNPTSSSVGSFAWLKRKPGNGRDRKSMIFAAEDHSSDLSPDSRPIVIGISVPSDDVGSHQVSPQTAVVETPMDMRSFSHKNSGKAPTPQQLRSVWSPDTEVSESPYSSRRAASSVYSQYTTIGGLLIAADAPPVPGLPTTMNVQQARAPQGQDEEDGGSPYTPFEEDDSPVAKRTSQKLKAVTPGPTSAGSGSHGWWDHVTTPFTPQINNPFMGQPQQTGSSSTSAPHEWWSGRDEKAGSSKASHLTIITPATQGEKGVDASYAITAASRNEPYGQGHSEKARVLSEDSHSIDAPPPYEFPKEHADAKIAFPQTYISSQPIPSPGPVTPGVRPVPDAVLPDRVVGTYLPEDHFYEAPGKANRTERQRRRHEKEDIVARKVGGFWRGRGCVPEEGCFGRTGRPKNSVAVSGCFTDETPSTAWSCSLPKEQQDSVDPYKSNQPEFIFQVQFDNSTQALWKLADEAKKPELDERDFVTDHGFKPNPAPPSLEEMRFLGNTTDGIESDRKEGEPTPFFISLLESIDKTVGQNVLSRRQGNAIGGSPGNGTAGFNFSDLVPPPELNPDGTGAPARLFPLSVQQPVRLFDRDLPTEHYGFYTYFDKKIYMVNSTKRDPADEDGGVPIADAHSLVTFAQTRFLVKIWTRLQNTTQLLNSADTSVNTTATPSVQPGSMPYPVTVIEDMHGGDQSKKMDFSYGVLANMEINRADAKGIIANIGFNGTLVNSRTNGPDESLGGVDGGTGGCKCEWVNFENI
ncbi:hypothetical protein ONZ43_g5135 [Nemania bipapillata]|uniref:Uncharacterized protein n=1 Tax=Nemania bipapillata TaxID=110536 RepID=A0ACC2IEA0_9PEZI|nr:hypothetical protein ONZ43_g5135 [Nemania bipapillata]